MLIQLETEMQNPRTILMGYLHIGYKPLTFWQALWQCLTQGTTLRLLLPKDI